MKWRSAGVPIFFTALACSPDPLLPERYVGLRLGMSAERWRELLPELAPDGPERLCEPGGDAAFRIADGAVIGARIVIRGPQAAALLGRYQAEFARYATPEAPYRYDLRTGTLELFSTPTALEIVWGADPGAAAPRGAPVAASAIAVPRVGERARGPGPLGAVVEQVADGVRVWLLPMPGPRPTQAAVHLVAALGSEGEGEGERGGTATAVELLTDEALREAAARHVQVEARTRRFTATWAFRGSADDVARVVEGLAAALRALPGRKLAPADLERALRRARTASRRVEPEDEALGLLLGVPPPVAEGESPNGAAIEARARALAGAPLYLIASGGIDPKYTRAIVAALGPRPVDARSTRAVAGALPLPIGNAAEWARALLLAALSGATLCPERAFPSLIGGRPVQNVDPASLDRHRNALRSGLVRALASPEDGGRLLVDLARLGGRPEWIPEAFAVLAGLEAADIEAYGRKARLGSPALEGTP